MKIILALIFLGVAFNQASADYCINCNLQKEYISAEQIVIKEDALFVIMNGEAIPVMYVAHDTEGFYCAKFNWTCPRCQTVNEWWRTKCKSCGY